MGSDSKKERWISVFPDDSIEYSLGLVLYDEYCDDLVIDLDSYPENRIIRFRFSNVITFRYSKDLYRQRDLYLNTEGRIPLRTILFKIENSKFIKELENQSNNQWDKTTKMINHYAFENDDFIIDIAIKGGTPILVDGKPLKI